MSRNSAPAGCGCAEFAMSRRRLLGTAAAGGTALAGADLLGGFGLFGEAFRQVAYGATGGNVVVVLSMRGGADGLSLVVPRGADHDLLTRLRPGIVVPETSLLGGDPDFGLHPAFAPLLPMWQAGSFGAVHAVGLPIANRSHFEAMQVIEEADPGSSQRRGWINRMVGLGDAAFPETAVQLGTGLLPTSMVGPGPALGVDQVADLSVADLGTDAAVRRASLTTIWGGDSGPLGDTVRSAIATADRLSPLAEAAGTDAKGGSVVHEVAYPKGPLQSVLANTAALIRADVGTSTVTIDYGNWDMHVGVGNAGDGWMHDQVAHLAGSLKAFFNDLGSAASRVTVVTISEFGRRVAENGDHGLDHGHGNVMLLLGAGVNGGAVRGGWPHLGALDDGDLAVRQDFRSVLWEVVASRFPDVTGSRSQVFPGLRPERIGAMT